MTAGGNADGAYRTFTVGDVLTEAEMAAQPFGYATDLSGQLSFELGTAFAAMNDAERHAFGLAAVQAAQLQMMTPSEVLRALLTYCDAALEA